MKNKSLIQTGVTTGKAKVITCPKCKGTGETTEWIEEESRHKPVTCPVCDGDKILLKIKQTTYERYSKMLANEWKLLH